MIAATHEEVRDVDDRCPGETDNHQPRQGALHNAAAGLPRHVTNASAQNLKQDSASIGTDERSPKFHNPSDQHCSMHLPQFCPPIEEEVSKLQVRAPGRPDPRLSARQEVYCQRAGTRHVAHMGTPYI